MFYLNYTKALQDNVLCNSYSFRHYFIFNFLDKKHDSYPQFHFSVCQIISIYFPAPPNIGKAVF